MTGNFDDKFVGRTEELASLKAWLDGSASKPLLIKGQAGIGKTSLLEYFLSTCSPQQDVVSLSGTDDPAELQRALAKLVPDKPILFVLDNMDSVPADSQLEVMHLLQSHPNSKALLTSRASLPLDIDLLDLPGLKTDAATELLEQHGALSSDDPNVQQLAALLGNHPLALKIAAGISKNKPLEEIIRELQANVYDIESQTGQSAEQTIQIVKPKLISATDEIIRNLKLRPEDIYDLPPRKFEELLAALLENLGWKVQLTPASCDGGCDILAYLETDLANLLCLVEAKRYRADRPVGVELIRTLYGTLNDHQASSALLVTTSHFTKGAKDFRSRHAYEINLKDFHDIQQWIAKYK